MGKRNPKTHDWDNDIFALYFGEKLLADGTVYEIAEKVGISVDTAMYYSYPSRAKMFANSRLGNYRSMVFLYNERTGAERRKKIAGKLSKKQVSNIKWLANNTSIHQREIGAKYGINQSVVSKIKRGIYYSNAKEIMPEWWEWGNNE